MPNVESSDPIVERWVAATVLVLPDPGEMLTANDLLDLIAAAGEQDARVVAVPVARLPRAFFRLSTGVAGEMVQKLANYRLRLAVVGELPEVARDSRAFMAWVQEGQHGRQAWFVPTLDALRSALDRPRDARRPDHIAIEPDRA